MSYDGKALNAWYACGLLPGLGWCDPEGERLQRLYLTPDLAMATYSGIFITLVIIVTAAAVIVTLLLPASSATAVILVSASFIILALLPSSPLAPSAVNFISTAAFVLINAPCRHHL